MTKFFYKAKDWNGTMVKGALESQDKNSVVESIKSGGLVPLSIVAESNSVLIEIYKKIFSKVKLKQISTFTRQLSTMMNSGLALTDALSLLKGQADSKSLMFEILDYTLATVQGGHTLSEGLGKYKKIFGEAYIASIDAGEEGGVLEEVLTKLADNLEEQSEFLGNVKGAMIYPTIVIIGMVAVMIIMMVFVIPKMMSLYDDFGAKMPMSTQILMSISGFMVKFWFLIPIVIVGFYMVLKTGNQNANFRLKRDILKLKVPIIGPMTQKIILADTIRTLSMLLAAGISLVDSLKIVSSVSANELFRGAYLKISERVQKGFSIANSFEETEVFPIIVNQMVATGEATGKLDSVLMKVSDYFSTEAQQSVKSLTAAIEPLIMIVLGLGVGFLVVAVLMPIYNLTSSM